VEWGHKQDVLIRKPEGVSYLGLLGDIAVIYNYEKYSNFLHHLAATTNYEKIFVIPGVTSIFSLPPSLSRLPSSIYSLFSLFSLLSVLLPPTF
jgi:hypothetical protein